MEKTPTKFEARFPYRYTFHFARRLDDWDVMDRAIEWTVENIGRPNFYWKENTIYFSRESDFLLFTLRWA